MCCLLAGLLQHVALQSAKSFTKELECFSKEGLAKHMEGHPKCPYCAVPIFSKEDLEGHMMEQHFVCQVCLLSDHREYFQEAEQYWQHLKSVPVLTFAALAT